jgi:hypothetical protein
VNRWEVSVDLLRQKLLSVFTFYELSSVSFTSLICIWIWSRKY